MHKKKKTKTGHAGNQLSGTTSRFFGIYCYPSDLGYLVDLNTPVVLDINLICPVQMTEALKIVPGNQKVEVAESASSSPIKNLISIPGSN